MHAPFLYRGGFTCPLLQTCFFKLSHSFNFTIDKPPTLTQVFYNVGVFQPRPPEILDGRPNVEGHVLDDVYTLHAAGVACIVAWMVDGIVLLHIGRFCRFASRAFDLANVLPRRKS